MRFLLFVWRSEFEYGESEPTQNKNPVRAKFYIYSEMEYKIHNSIIWKFIYKKKVCFFFFFWLNSEVIVYEYPNYRLWVVLKDSWETYLWSVSYNHDDAQFVQQSHLFP